MRASPAPAVSSAAGAGPAPARAPGARPPTASRGAVVAAGDAAARAPDFWVVADRVSAGRHARKTPPAITASVAVAAATTPGRLSARPIRRRSGAAPPARVGPPDR